jgi:pimeloyl-ACP methyl ester carboxylesterase
LKSLRPATHGLAAVRLCLAVVLLCLASTGLAHAGARVYLLRGIFNVSAGLDALADKLAGLGIAASVYGHAERRAVAALAARQYEAGHGRPIILIGHSLGAGAAVATARQLNDSGIPVALVVLLDPVSGEAVPPNVSRAVNLYVSGGLGTTVEAEPGFRGSLSNLDFKSAGMDHMSIQASDSIHRQIIGYVRVAAAGGGSVDSLSARHDRASAHRRKG